MTCLMRFLFMIWFFALSACGNATLHTIHSGYGPNPNLPAPQKTLLPVLKTAKAIGWQANSKPNPAAGLKVNAYASKLQHPRWLFELPNGDVLVAETNQPPRPSRGIRDWVVGLVMKRVGAGGGSPNRIILLRDTDHDGVADFQSVFIDDLNSPFGMALHGDDLYVANTDALLRFQYQTGQSKIHTPAVKVMDLPAGEINSHWTKNLLLSPDQQKLYITVGSNSNIGERGMQQEIGRAAIWVLDLVTKETQIFASGLRNPNGMAWEPLSQRLWVVVNERDELGDDLVPDYLTSVQAQGFYGWPYSYYGQHVDTRVSPQQPELVARAIAPDYALGAHTASLGLAYSEHNSLGKDFQSGMFVGQHGSWNRSELSGYKVIFIPFKQGKPAGMPKAVLTGFIDAQGNAQGRPVGVLVDHHGALLVADDVGNTIWRVSP